MFKIYWLEYVNANHNHSHEGIITESFWCKSDMNRRRYELMPNNEIMGYGYDMVELD